MAKRYKKPKRHRDSGATWISYSDMMSALLLVFVLVLCFSIYQYFVMLETKTTELDEKEALLTTQETTLAEQKSTLASQKNTLAEQESTLAEQANVLSAQQAILDAQQTDLEAKELALITQQTELDSAYITLEAQQTIIADKEKTIADAQVELETKETELSNLKVTLDQKESDLSSATTQLEAQQQLLNNQQQKLDDLVGVRTQIIHDLSFALAKANLKAQVDHQTGDIMLESTVFFDVSKHFIKQSGQDLLNEFIPIYLGVLLQPQYVDFLGEIVIEGHTDTTGTYLDNLALSQERALSVATFCLKMPSLSETQLDMLRSILTAKGRSESDPLYTAEGTIDMNASRRVEFKFRLKDSEMIDEIRTILNPDVAN